MSLGASGALGKALVFFPWKGLDVVREYVVPTNPDTTLQQTQRDHLKDAVALVHSAQARAANPLNETDQIAYAALASTKAEVMTWFNQVVKLYLDTILTKIGDAEVPVIYSGGEVTDKDVSALDVFMKLNEETDSTLTHGKFYFGTSKTNLIHSKAGTVTAGDKVVLEDEDCSAFLTAGKKYYWQFRPDADKPCEGADSGIYHFVAE